MSYMRLKNGFNVCSRCSGKGCHHCGRRGYIVLCPVCAQAEPEFIQREGDDYKCLGCEAKFTRQGRVVDNI